VAARHDESRKAAVAVGLAGAAVLAGSLFLPWYDVSRPATVGPAEVSGWQAFDRIDAVLTGIALLAIPCLLARRGARVSAARIALGATAVVVIAWKTLALPLIPPAAGATPAVYVHASGILVGPIVALVGAAGLVASGVIDALGVRRRGDPAGVYEAPAVGPGTGPEVRQAGELRSARIESLRAIAALGVLLGHAYAISQAFGPRVWDSYGSRLLTGGGLGVYLFLVLSGYLLFWPFAKHAFGDGGTAGEAGGPLRRGRYALNRAVRILPLYYAVLLVLLGLQHGGGSASQWWHFALFAQNFSRATIAQVDSPMWTLGVEIHFYIALPVLVWALARVARGSLRAGALWLGGLFVVALGVRLALIQFQDHPDFRLHYSLATLLPFFLAGMLLALLRLAWQDGAPAWLRGVAASSDAWILGAAALYLVLCVNLFDLEALTAPASVLLIGACVLPLRPGRLQRVLEWRPLALVGVASYSLYLWHVPVLLTVANATVGFDPRVGGVFAGPPTPFLRLLLVGAPAAIAVAFVSYAVIERPFLGLRRRWAGAGAAPVSAARTPPPRPARTGAVPRTDSAAP
jgi:peptidoglycan/LPS O-acetylase OafA/YrhL